MELIDRKALGVCRCNPDVFKVQSRAEGWNSLLEIVNSAPTIDAVPVVMCRECVYKDTTACPAYDAPFARTSLRIKFCNEGRRREADHEISKP